MLKKIFSLAATASPSPGPDNLPRVLMLTTQLGYGGSETSFVRLANALSDHMHVTIVLFTPDYGSESYSKGGLLPKCTVKLLDDDYQKGGIRRWWRRWKRLRRIKAEHHVTVSFLSGPNILNVLAGSNSRSVISIRGSLLYDPVMHPWKRSSFRYLLDPIALNLADRVVAISEGLAHEAIRIGGSSIKQKITVIPPFVEIEELFERAREPPPSEFCMLSGQPVIAAIGRLSVEKGFQHLIRVFSALAVKIPGAKLLLIGDGPMLAELKGLCKKGNIAINDYSAKNASVIFTGYRTNPLAFLSMARIVVSSSASEGFGLAILEALASGVPVIAADTPWGARAILSKSSPQSMDPYPTTAPTVSDYGILMPRIDDDRFHDIWVDTLTSYLSDESSAVFRPDGRDRARDFDAGRIVENWRRLIAECECDQAQSENRFVRKRNK